MHLTNCGELFSNKQLKSEKLQNPTKMELLTYRIFSCHGYLPRWVHGPIILPTPTRCRRKGRLGWGRTLITVGLGLLHIPLIMDTPQRTARLCEATFFLSSLLFPIGRANMPSSKVACPGAESGRPLSLTSPSDSLPLYITGYDLPPHELRSSFCVVAKLKVGGLHHTFTWHFPLFG